MNILFLGEPQSPNTISWVEGLRALGCVVTIASARSDGRDGAYPIGPVSFPPRLRVLVGTSDIKKLIKKFNPDILIAYRVTSYGYLAARTGFHPLVLAAQNENIAFHPTHSNLRGKLLSYFAKYAIGRADLIHSWSVNVSKGLKRFDASDEQILQLHRGINTAVFKAPENWDFQKTHIKLISTRALYPQYRIGDLIKAFSVFNSKYEDSSLVITGDGPMKQDLVELSKKLELLGKVVFTGRVSPEKVAKELKDADIYVSLIETEGLSSSLLEACSCGVFPIVADIPASRCLIEPGKNGMLLSNTSTAELAKALCSLIEKRELLKSGASFNAKLISEKFDREKNLRKFVEKYSSLIEKYKQI